MFLLNKIYRQEKISYTHSLTFVALTANSDKIALTGAWGLYINRHHTDIIQQKKGNDIIYRCRGRIAG